MGIFSRRAPVIDVAELAKAVALAMPAVTPAAVMLPREDFGGGYPFSPGMPLVPYGIDPRNPTTQRPDPRRSEFPISVNMQVTSTRMLPFPTLRESAERVDVIRRCIEVRKSQMLALDWDIRLSKEALSQIMEDENISSPGKAAELARLKFAPDINRLRRWWQKPDRFNGQNFSSWLGLLLEEQLVLDAVTVWPVRQANGDVVAFEVLDGSTIKPLLDHRGSTPRSPNPAYQQVLYGFPRGEFTASNSDKADGYLFDQLVYRPRYVRSWTPYGCPNTEQALAAADLYLKRMGWIRGEFTNGTTPDTWLKTPGTSKMTPAQIKEWETAINAELAGMEAERRHLRMLPPGYEPEQMRNFADLYKADLDEFTIKLICMCFDIMPTEIGFTPNQGIGGKGHQEGEANSAQRKSVRPTAVWIEDLLTDLSRDYLGMPPQLEFKLLGYEIEDQNSAEEVADSQVRRGAVTMNEDRAARGLPMYDFDEADEPFIVGPSGVIFLRGAIAAQAAAAAPVEPSSPEATPAVDASAKDPRPADTGTYDGPGDVPAEGDVIAADEEVPEGFIRVQGHLRRKQGARVDEAAKFLKFATARKGKMWRDFTFEHLDGVALNAAGRTGDLDLIKTLVADVGKAQARTVSRADKDRLIAKHAPLIASAIRDAMPSATSLINGFTTDKADGDRRSAAKDYVTSVIGKVSVKPIVNYQTAGHNAAWNVISGDDPDPSDPPSRLKELWDKAPAVRDALVVSVVGLTVDALLSRDPETNLDAVASTASESFATNELTNALAAGTRDVAEKYGMTHVRIVASAGDCDFCDGYDGRIMSPDDSDGMPPLHRGCSCDIEPLD